MKFDPKEHANWLVNRGVPIENLICPMCGNTGILRAMNPMGIYHVDDQGEPARDVTGRPTGANLAPIACASCGYLRLFILDVGNLPPPSDEPAL